MFVLALINGDCRTCAGLGQLLFSSQMLFEALGFDCMLIFRTKSAKSRGYLFWGLGRIFLAMFSSCALTVSDFAPCFFLLLLFWHYMFSDERTWLWFYFVRVHACDSREGNGRVGCFEQMINSAEFTRREVPCGRWTKLPREGRRCSTLWIEDQA